MTQDPVDALAINAQQSVIAAHRYLAFIHCEHRFLLNELYPGIEKGDVRPGRYGGEPDDVQGLTY